MIGAGSAKAGWGKSRPGAARQGMAPLFSSWLVAAWRGTVRQARTRLGVAGPFSAPLTHDQAWPGVTGQDAARQDEAWHGMAPLGLAGLPAAEPDMARQDVARLGEARPGVTGHGEARFGWAGHGWARHRAPSTNTAASWGT